MTQVLHLKQIVKRIDLPGHSDVERAWSHSQRLLVLAEGLSAALMYAVVLAVLVPEVFDGALLLMVALGGVALAFVRRVLLNVGELARRMTWFHCWVSTFLVQCLSLVSFRAMGYSDQQTIVVVGVAGAVAGLAAALLLPYASGLLAGLIALVMWPGRPIREFLDARLNGGFIALIQRQHPEWLNSEGQPVLDLYRISPPDAAVFVLDPRHRRDGHAQNEGRAKYYFSEIVQREALANPARARASSGAQELLTRTHAGSAGSMGGARVGLF